ncbi:non-ribosomal peptide synthetase [Micromonospora cathayae]|uniref:Amino acid adenylation domain-containing protein n=1 Tax=Micromonospora cathayae TaxID=3028804 RepID=A0ABY7ZS85_9ACTN|nr:non-ribosomal peptide synthetase [Micromonospora sp. HUAS 3]WDZ85825.1 amino acid adenylation domain-containing protein [Micromonospora sp. HUAS 3]
MAESLVDRFAATRSRHPHRIAVVDDDRKLTYRELDTAADRVAARLRQLGVGRGDLVGVCAERGVDLVVLLLGVLKAGAAYLPLDPTYPKARLEYLVTDSACRLIVGVGSFGALFAGTGTQYLDPTTAASATAESPTTAASATAAPDTVAADADVPDGTGPGPDDLAYVIYTSGSTGRPKGVMVSHRNVTRLFDATRALFRPGPEDVWTLFHSFAFDFSVWEIWGALLHGGQLVVVPYLTSRDPGRFWELLRRHGVTILNQTPSAFRTLLDAAGTAGFPATSLRFVVFGGERLDPPVLRPWFAAYGDRRPELVNMYGITETTVHVTARIIRESDTGRDRSPIGRPIADLRLHLLDRQGRPVAPGERGELYVAGPGVARGYLRRPALTAQRFLPDPDGPPGARMYHSGDLASVAPDGELVIHGRADDQIQFRGFRIELGEVEHALRAVPGVRHGVVVPEDDGDDLRLVAYVVTDDGATPDVRAALAEQLPAHAVPAETRLVASLPLTANGKVDRSALADVWAAGLPSGNQQRLLFLTELAPESNVAYTIPAVVRLVGDLDLPALSAAVDDLVARHPALRTGLVSTPGGVVTVGVPASGGLLRTIRVPDEETALARARELIRTPFDLTRPPLLRALLVTLAADVHLLVLAVHHVVADGWSLGVLAGDLSACYAARRDGTDPPPSRDRGPGDFVRWHRRQAADGALAAGLEYWRNTLRGVPTVLELPGDHPRADRPRYTGGRTTLLCPPALVRRVTALARAEGVTPYAVLLSCFAAQVARTTGRTDMVIGSPAAGRPGPAFDGTVGYFANTLPLRLRPAAGASLRALLRPVHEQVLRGLEHQYVPFDQIVAAVDPVRDPARQPLVQVVFGYHGPHRFAPRLPGLRSSRVVAVDPGTTRFDLLVEAVDTEDGLLVAAEYDSGRYQPETAASFLAGYLDLLTEAVLDPDRPLPRDTAPVPVGSPETPADLPSGPAEHPGSELERRIATLYGEVLHAAVVGREDNFFALGGDSIRVLRLVAAARDRGLPLGVEQVFRTPTVAALAASLAPAGEPPTPDGVSGVPQGHVDPLTDADRQALPPDVTAAYPMAALQVGIIFHCQLAEDPTLYHDLVSVRLAGRLDPVRLRRALAVLAGRHEVLRTSLDLGSYSVPLQLVHEEVTVPLEFVAADPAAGSPRAALRAWWRGQWQRGFDPATAPLWRCHVLTHPDGTVDLAVSACHAILDGWSFATLMAELLRLLDDTDGGATLPPTVPYREFVALEQRSIAAERDRGYWRSRVAGVATALPGPTGPAAEYLPAEPAVAEPPLDPDVLTVVPADLAASVTALARELGAQTKHVYLAAHFEALGELWGVGEVSSGVVVSGRPERSGAEHSLGVFLNTVPVTVPVAGTSGAVLVTALSRLESEYLPHRRFPLAEMQRMAGGPLHRVRVNFADFHVLDTLTGLRRFRILDWWSCDRNEIPLSVEVTRQPMSDAVEIAVRVGAGVSARDGERFAELMVAALRRSTAGVAEVTGRV